MSAGRHSAVGKPAVSALKLAGWMLMVALFGFAIYWLTVATDLEFWGALCLVWLPPFVKSVMQWRSDKVLPWLAAGALLTTTVQFANALAKYLHWSAGSLHSLALIGDVVDGVVAVVLGVLAVIWIRTVALPWLRRRFAHS